MRILVITFQFPPRVGGIETMAYELSKQMNRAGADISVLASSDPDQAKFDAKQTYPVYRIPIGPSDTLAQRTWQKVELFRAVNRIIREVKPDCTLCMHWDPCAYLARAAGGWSAAPRPYYLVAHGMELLQLPAGRTARWAKAKLRGFALAGAREIFAVSQYTRERVISLGTEAKRVIVIPNGVDLNGKEERPGLPRKPEAPRILLTLARLVPRKGHDTVLRSLPRVLEQVPNLTYRIVGEGPESERLTGLVRQLRIESHVEFYGKVSEREKENLLNTCDVFVLPCRQTETDFEGFGISLLEAMSHKKPVIAGRSGGVPDVVSHGETGWLVDPADVEALASRIVHVLQNETEASRLASNAFQRVQEQFNWQTIGRQYLAAMSVGA